MAAKKKKPVRRRIKCDHYWMFLHVVWQAHDDDQSAVAVARYCSKCETTQTAIASKWKPVPKSFVDMREALKTEMEE